VLIRTDPFRDRPRLTHGQLGGASAPRVNGMPFDAYRQGDTFFAHFDMPGVDPSSIELTVEKNVLTVKAQRTHQWGDGVELVVNERPSGSFTRQLTLSDSLGTDLIVATCDNGVLTVAIPVTEDRATARKIEVNGNGNGQSSTIPAHASAHAPA
jgi:HSP20 family protein